MAETGGFGSKNGNAGVLGDCGVSAGFQVGANHVDHVIHANHANHVAHVIHANDVNHATHVNNESCAC